MSYTWDDLYSSKTDRELFQIYLKGTFAEKKKATEHLEDRGFDFDNVEKYKERWELEKLLKKKQSWESGFHKWTFGFDMTSILPMVLFIPIIYSIGDIVFQLTGFKEKELLQSLLILIGLFIIQFISFRVKKRRDLERSRTVDRIKELKGKLKV